MKKIFVITQPEFVDTVGGAITVCRNFCNLLEKNNFTVYAIVSVNNKNKPLGLNKKIKFVNLYGKYNYSSFSIALNNFVRKINPDLIIFFFVNQFNIVNFDDDLVSIPKIIMFHSRPDFYFAFGETSLKQLEKKYINITSQILFDSYYNLLPSFIQNNKVITIPNGFVNHNIRCNSNITKHRIVYLSRIDSFKGLELLIKSYSIVAKKYKNWELHIFGQSQPPLYQIYLEKLIKNKGLSKQIFFKGITKNSYLTLSQYDFCVFPSYFEGFPMGLIEAQSVGLPCVGLKKATGVNQLIIDKVNGMLVNDNPKSLSNSIIELIKDKNLRLKYSQNSIKYSAKYDLNNINNVWISTINNIINNDTIKKSIYEKKEQNNFKIKKIKKMTYGYAKKSYVNFYLSTKFKKIAWFLIFVFFKFFAPDGSERQKIIIKIYKKIK